MTTASTSISMLLGSEIGRPSSMMERDALTNQLFDLGSRFAGNT
jgi:hypothetical protein